MKGAIRFIRKDLGYLVEGMAARLQEDSDLNFFVIVKSAGSVDCMISDQLTYYDALTLLEVARDTVHHGGLWEE